MLDAPGITTGSVDVVVVEVPAPVVEVEPAGGDDVAAVDTCNGARVADGRRRAPMTTATITTPTPRSQCVGPV